MKIYAQDTIFASGGIGGRYQHSTNFPHLTGDALDISRKHGIRLEHLDYVQIHPTTLYSSKPGRRFLISESVRGEGAVLYNKDGERFVNELLPRDVVTKAIREQMEKTERIMYGFPWKILIRIRSWSISQISVSGAGKKAMT